MSKYGPRPRHDSELFFNKVELVPMSGCWIWTAGLFFGGYGQFNPKEEGRSRFAHRWSWEHFNGPIPNGLHVLHRCDVRCCVSPHHLFIGTQLDNIRDMDAKGRRVNAPTMAEHHHNAKLTIDTVKKILASNSTNVSLAREYGVKPSAISKIRHGRTWQSL